MASPTIARRYRRGRAPIKRDVTSDLVGPGRWNSTGTDHVAALRGEDVRRVARPHRTAIPVQCDEADTALDDQAVMTIGDDLTEAHPSNRVEREPRFHPDV